jgi:hypothetical protein
VLAQLFVEERGTRVAVAVLNSSAVKETAAKSLVHVLVRHLSLSLSLSAVV